MRFRTFQRLAVAIALASSAVQAGALRGAAQPAPFVCSEMLGFSQTAQWYQAGFITSLPNPENWQLRWASGGSIDLWADPNYSGWGGATLVSHCKNGSSTPDRVVVNVSGDYQTDPGWWARKTRQVIDIVHARYPRVRQIGLQPVVGGPGGGRCPVNDRQASQPFVRATYNYPYIKQGLAADVGGDVVFGASPEVRSCADYAGDWAGHLPDWAAQPVGASVASFWASVDAASPAVAPAPAPAPEPADQPPPAPANDAVPTATAGQTITFDDLPAPNRALTGQAPAGLIDWGDGAWWLSGPYGQLAGNSISFNGAGPTSASFDFVSPRVLSQLDVYNGGKAESQVSLSCDGTPTASVTVKPGQLVSLPSGFGAPCTTVGVTSSNGWDTNFKNFVLDNPAP